MGLQFARDAARDGRGEEACLGRSREILRRPRFREVADRRLDLEKICGRTTQTDRSRPRRESVEAGNPSLGQGDTIYLCTADDEGNMVSLIQSNYRGMGSGIVVPGLGFMFQDRGELFSMEPGHANVYAPGKRPFHTIIPGFVMKDQKPWVAFGVMGGGMQPQGHVQVLTNMIDFGMNVQEAGDAARWQHEGDNEPTGEKMTQTAATWRSRAASLTRPCAALKLKGHDVRYDVGGYGGYQAIKVEMHDGQRVYVGASEAAKTARPRATSASGLSSRITSRTVRGWRIGRKKLYASMSNFFAPSASSA